MFSVGILLLAASLVGSGLLGWAVWLAGRFGREIAGQALMPVSLLKPLHGDEPRLLDNLRTFLDQRSAVAPEIVLGVCSADDAARPAAAALAAEAPAGSVQLVVDQRPHGSNPKVSNVINIAARARRDVLVLSDSDIAVEPGYLPAVLAALARPGVGAVTCLYRGRGDAGLWSRLVAMGIDLQFLPQALIGLGTGLASPCLGSTIAIRRDVLARAGGFEGVADTLADDHAIGAAVRGLGLDVAVADTLVTHGCSERSLSELVRHELRWNATVASIDRAGYAGSVVLHPLPLALLAGACLGFGWPALVAVVVALGVRAAMMERLTRLTGERAGGYALIPVRDLLSFALFAGSFFVRTVDWRGRRLAVDEDLSPPVPVLRRRERAA